MPTASWTDLPEKVLAILRAGAVLPAHPLALDERRRFDQHSQRALTTYCIDAGAGGLAVGVHATQFRIGATQQAVDEAPTARALRYRAVLLGLSAMQGASEDAIVEPRATIARHMPLIGLHRPHLRQLSRTQ